MSLTAWIANAKLRIDSVAMTVEQRKKLEDELTFDTNDVIAVVAYINIARREDRITDDDVIQLQQLLGPSVESFNASSLEARYLCFSLLKKMVSNKSIWKKVKAEAEKFIDAQVEKEIDEMVSLNFEQSDAGVLLAVSIKPNFPEDKKKDNKKKTPKRNR